MKLIAFICPSLSLGGAERHLLRYVKGLHLRGYAVSIFVIGSGAALANEVPSGVEVIFLNGRFRDPRTLISLNRLLRHKRPDVVFGWSSIASFMACIAAPKQSRLVACELNYPPLAYRAYGFPTYLAWRVMTQLYRRADVVAANSEAALEVLKAWVGRAPQFIRIYNPIEFALLEKLSLERIEPALAASSIRIVAVGRLDNQHKGFDVLISALAGMSAQQDWSCVIVGGGPDKKALEDQVAQVKLGGRVFIVGAQANPFPYVKSADIFVLPSRREGFPNALLEAMALGKAVIAADCFTGPREITDGGRCGILFPVDDHEQLAKEITKLIREPELRKQLGAAAAERTRKAWSDEAVFARLIDVVGWKPSLEQ